MTLNLCLLSKWLTKFEIRKFLYLLNHKRGIKGCQHFGDTCICQCVCNSPRDKDRTLYSQRKTCSSSYLSGHQCILNRKHLLCACIKQCLDHTCIHILHRLFHKHKSVTQYFDLKKGRFQQIQQQIM